MSAVVSSLDPVVQVPPRSGSASRVRSRGTAPDPASALPPRRQAPPISRPWIRAQSINVARHAGALRPFSRREFGTSAASPSEGHVRATNELLVALRGQLMRKSQGVDAAARAAEREPTTEQLQRLVTLKEQGHDLVRAVEQVWDFYFELFGQRQSRYADWLLSCDRIALNCYQVSFTNIAVAKSVPAPAPFSYMRTGFSPATFRRGVALRQLGRLPNPFPLIQLPYHRLVNPWTLGAILHEVSHNLQNDLGLAGAVPRRIAARLQREGLPRSVVATWVRWNRELFADLNGLLLGGPAVVGSLLDVVGRSPATVFGFSARGPHPTPYLRTLVSTELLRRMGFASEAERYRRLWTRTYPNPRAGNIPGPVLDTFLGANAAVVDEVCFQPFKEIGNVSLSRVARFAPKDQQLVEEAAKRLASGTDPGVVPSRFLIAASRVALDRRYARPGTITRNFYIALARR